VNEGRNENEIEREEEVSRLEGMDCILGKLDVSENLEGMGFDSSRYSDHREILIHGIDEGGIPACGVDDLKYCEMLDHVG
jgi:hypothetical protein